MSEELSRKSFLSPMRHWCRGHFGYLLGLTTQAAYAYGELGVDECPDGYSPIYDTVQCSLASDFVGDTYDPDRNVLNEGAVCNGRTCGATCADTRVSDNHGSVARWLCSKMASAPCPPSRPRFARPPMFLRCLELGLSLPFLSLLAPLTLIRNCGVLRMCIYAVSFVHAYVATCT